MANLAWTDNDTSHSLGRTHTVLFTVLCNRMASRQGRQATWLVAGKDYGAKEMVHEALFSDPKGASNPTKQDHPSWLDTSAVRRKKIQSQQYR